MNATARELADWISTLEVSAIPDSVLQQTGLRVLDTLGLILAGTTTPAAEPILQIVTAQGQGEQASLLPVGRRCAASWAGFAHGVLAHCRDFDDTFQDSVVHPGSIVVSSALAVGEAAAADDETISAAITAGYEIAARLGAVAGRRFHQRGFHATGIVGPFAAAATAGRILGLDGAEMTSALGLCGSLSSGLMTFLDDGSWSKWLHVGWAAHGGILAAELASRGFRGPHRILDARHNLYDAFLHGEVLDKSVITRNLGTAWAGQGACFKTYPCAHVIQPFLDAAIEWVGDENLRSSHITRIDCRLAPWAAAIVAEPREKKIRPENEVAALASLPYMLAVAFRDRGVTLAALETEMRTQGDLLEFASRITHTVDPDLGNGFDGILGLEMSNGQRFTRRVEPRPPDRDRLVEKFHANAQRVTDATSSARLENIVMGQTLPDFGRLFTTLARPFPKNPNLAEQSKSSP